MPIIIATDQDFEQKVVQSKTPVLVDFYADWCGPCKMAEPILEELAKEHDGKVSFVKVNVDENKESAQKHQVMSIPTTILFKDGREVDRQIGFSGKKNFEELLNKAFIKGGD
jgi:thioredoxin 1